MTLRSLYYALLWIAVGAIATILVEAYFFSRPQTATVTDQLHRPPGSSFTKSLADFDYTVPLTLTVGDVGDARMHITNRHIWLIDKKTRKATSAGVPVIVSLVTSPNCTATETTTIPGATYILSKVGVPNAFDWNISATGPGQCNLEFRTRIWDLLEINSLTVPVRDRFGAEQQATILAGIIIALPGLIGLFIKKRAT